MLSTTEVSKLRAGFDFFQTGSGAYATTQTDSPSPTTVKFLWRQSRCPSTGSS